MLKVEATWEILGHVKHGEGAILIAINRPTGHLLHFSVGGTQRADLFLEAAKVGKTIEVTLEIEP